VECNLHELSAFHRHEETKGIVIRARARARVCVRLCDGVSTVRRDPRPHTEFTAATMSSVILHRGAGFLATQRIEVVTSNFHYLDIST